MTSTVLFTVAQARELMPEVRAKAATVIQMRADLAELSLSLREGDESDGGVAEVKALEAHLNEAVGWFSDNGIEVKGIAPLLIDFPSTIDGHGVRLCWLEGESELIWYHRDELGFAGRRLIDETGEA